MDDWQEDFERVKKLAEKNPAKARTHLESLDAALTRAEYGNEVSSREAEARRKALDAVRETARAHFVEEQEQLLAAQARGRRFARRDTVALVREVER